MVAAVIVWDVDDGMWMGSVYGHGFLTKVTPGAVGTYLVMLI